MDDIIVSLGGTQLFMPYDAFHGRLSGLPDHINEHHREMIALHSGYSTERHGIQREHWYNTVPTIDRAWKFLRFKRCEAEVATCSFRILYVQEFQEGKVCSMLNHMVVIISVGW